MSLVLHLVTSLHTEQSPDSDSEVQDLLRPSASGEESSRQTLFIYFICRAPFPVCHFISCRPSFNLLQVADLLQAACC